MTSGSENGTSGGGFRIGPWTAVALVGAVVATVNATSGILEARRDDWDVHWSEPIVWEVSSAIVIIGMAPLIGWAMQRWPVRGDNLVASGLIHLALTVPYSLIHIVAIWLMRESAYAAVGAHYGFFHDDGVAITILYEWRKDVLSYAAIAAMYWWFQRQAERPPPEKSGDERIEIRDGATAVFLAPRELLFVEAAGNYITFNTAARNYLVRGTLASWEARLAAKGFVRVHRSRLVNRARIAAMKPTQAGDLEITLDDGRTVLGSRRYRSAFEASQTPVQ